MYTVCKDVCIINSTGTCWLYLQLTIKLMARLRNTGIDWTVWQSKKKIISRLLPPDVLQQVKPGIPGWLHGWLLLGTNYQIIQASSLLEIGILMITRIALPLLNGRPPFGAHFGSTGWLKTTLQKFIRKRKNDIYWDLLKIELRKIKNYTFWDLFKHTKISKINHRKAPSKSKHRYRYIPYFVLQPYESKLDTTSRGSSGSETLLRISGQNIRPYLTSGGAGIRRCMIIQRIWHLRYQYRYRYLTKWI